MSFKKKILKTTILCIIVMGSATFLKAAYYEPDLFPIGLTGINYTGDWNCPYENKGPGWTWYKEDSLIRTLGINCIGCSDAWPKYLVDLKPTELREDNYHHKVCLPTFSDGIDDGNEVYLIPNGLWIDEIICHGNMRNCDGEIKDPWASGCDTIPGTHEEHRKSCNANVRFSTLFRPWNHDFIDGATGYAPDEFDDTTGGPEHYLQGPQYYGDESWWEMMDEGVTDLGTFMGLCNSNNENLKRCFWGWNILVEEPAIYRGPGARYTTPDPKEGVWGGVTRVISGEGTGGSHFGVRGVEDTCMDGYRRTIVAKGGTYPLHMANLNIFQGVPHLDAFIYYQEGGWAAEDNYGEQIIWDKMLYGHHYVVPDDPREKTGWQHTAGYFQRFGKTGGRDHRRWMTSIGLSWYHINLEGTKSRTRRPCPPEIRCATYLALSRGAKGIFFVPWLLMPCDCKGGAIKEYPKVRIPCTDDPGRTCMQVGMRDHHGYPFGYPGHNSEHYLNVGVGNGASTYWHDPDNCKDYTYVYLKDTFIPEIKGIGPTLVQLEWDSAFSLASTVDTLAKPCPHGYVDTVITTDSGYIDLGFFEPCTEMWRDQGEYLMVVNRDGIADNKPDTITLYLDFLEGDTLDSLYVIEFGDPNTDSFLPRASDGYFHLAEDYAPGEGKLFRFYPIKAGSGDRPQLMLWGECKETGAATGLMGPLSEGNTYCAELTWMWVDYMPSDLDSMKLWRKDSGAWDTVENHPHPIDEWTFTDTVFMNCDSCCAEFLEMGYHESGYEITEPEELSGAVGTKSNIEEVCCNKTSGCPDLYSFIYEDTTVSPGYLFLENNTILPHSEHVQSMDVDLLKLDMINDDPDHYYLNISENDDETSYLDQAKLWVVDHNEGTQVATSADDSIYVYSEMAAPTYCKDNLNNDRLDQVLWQDSLSFVGPTDSYLIVEFDDPEWTNKGILVFVDPSLMAKACKIELDKVGGGGGWDSIGTAYARLNSSQWLINVSDADSFRFRLMCKGSDTTFIDRIALVKLETSGWTKQEAALDSAVKWIPVEYEDYMGIGCRLLLLGQDTLVDTLQSDYQWSFSFTKVDTSITYPLRDYIFQSRGYYSTAITPPSGIEEAPLKFGLHVEQLPPLSRIALINYSVPYATHVKIAIYDVAGRLTKSVIDEKVKPGRYSEEWKGQDDVGRTLASGVYFVKMVTDDYKKTVKIVILE